jgi:hypothetical protein
MKDYFYSVNNQLQNLTENFVFWVGSDIEKEDFVVTVCSNKIQISSINSTN